MSNDDLNILLVNIGSVIKRHRTERGLSQLTMGFDIDMSANQIGRIERAESNPTIETLHTIANYFGFDMMEYFIRK
ncbi:MAG: transcriptional regulator [Pseudozobellia sp.]|nr:transcriptional regulator [Pseudozobellia sp.]MBG48055.1 transcriptional regulator [Pseudozobellia sp.]|tara:strand:+ start:239 stop:466 length:228 start_codon:yes stop_codon:yes gene_type:complete